MNENPVVPYARCRHCHEQKWWDNEAGEPIPHRCPEDYIETAQEAFWAEEVEEDNG